MTRREFWTVEQAAQALDKHPKTIRRYIREGVLKAVKLGGQWRIKADDLGAWMDTQRTSRQQEMSRELQAFINGTTGQAIDARDEKLQVCVVMDYYVNSAPEAAPLSQALIDLMNSGDPDQGRAKYEYVFDPDAKKARFVLWGNPRFLSKMLQAAAALQSQ